MEYFRKPLRCFLVEFLEALEKRQLREIRRQNPIDHSNRSERLRALEAKMLSTSPNLVIQPIASKNVQEELNPAFTKTEILSHLTLSKKEAVPGLFIFCHTCLTKKKKCKHPAEKEAYKLIIRTQSINVSYKKEFNGIRDEEVAKSLAKELRRITIAKGSKQTSLTKPVQNEVRNIIHISELMKDHLDYQEKNNDIIKASLKTKRQRYDFMLNVFKENGYDPSTVMVDQLDKSMQNGYTLLKKLSNALDNIPGRKPGTSSSQTTRNDYITTYLSLFKYAIETRELNIKNPFKNKLMKKGNVREEIINKIKTIYEGELKRLFDMLRSGTPLKKKLTYFSKTKNKEVTDTKNYYQPYLLDGIRLGLALGLRSQNIGEVKWSDIDLDEAVEGSIRNGIIHVFDIKVNNQKKITRDESKKVLDVRINDDIMDILYDMGYEKYKDSQHYILAPTHKHDRETIMKNVSKGFHHYMKEVSSSEDFQFKDLRKTQISREGIALGKERASKRVHGGMRTTEGHYFDRRLFLASADDNPTVFKGVRLAKL